MKEKRIFYRVRSVKESVKQAISKYCTEKGITQSNYLENDRRIKDYL